MLRNRNRRPCRHSGLRAGLFLGGLLTALPAAAQDAPKWTLPDALETAFDQSPVLRDGRAALQQVAGRLLGAKTFPHNPELTLELADRRGPGAATTDRGLSLSQELELAGQRRKRIAVADAELAAAGAVFERDLQRLAFRVESAFAEAVRARELLGVAEIDAALAREVLAFSSRRLERGATTQIEVNLARASAGRAEQSLERARAAYASARSLLAEVSGANPQAPPEPVAELALPADEPLPAAALLELAFDNRRDLRAVERQRLAAEAAVRLAVAGGRPNLLVGGFFQREEATDDIFGATVGISLPLFDRNQGPIAESRAARERVRHQRDALRLAIEREVVNASNDLRAARAAAEHLRDQVLDTLDENVDLLQRSFAAGRIGAAEVVTLRREFVASRREHIEALADAWLARLALDLAVGRLVVPTIPTGKEQP